MKFKWSIAKIYTDSEGGRWTPEGYAAKQALLKCLKRAEELARDKRILMSEVKRLMK